MVQDSFCGTENLDLQDVISNQEICFSEQGMNMEDSEFCEEESPSSMMMMFSLMNKRPQSTIAGTSSNGGSYQIEMDHEERPSSCKRAKFMEMPQQKQWNPAISTVPTQSDLFNTMDEPSPLGLTLRKTHSLLDLIQTKLSEGVTSSSEALSNLDHEMGEKRDAAAQSCADKLKASNFPASTLKIGTWECIARNESDLVVKCFFAKRKLVWEVLECVLKSKIEIQWSDIIALKANCPDSEPGTLEIEVSRPPLFFRETSTQPRKHTLWQPTSDFTGGQATISKRHFLQFPQGVLNRHYEKIIQCDPRLNLLSRQSIISRDSLYYDSRNAAIQDQSKQSCYGALQVIKSHAFPQFGYLENDHLPHSPIHLDTVPTMPSILVPKLEPTDPIGRMVGAIPLETPSPSSVMELWAIEESGSSDNEDLSLKGVVQWEQLGSSTPFNCFMDQGCGLILSTAPSTSANQLDSVSSQYGLSYNSLSAGDSTWSSNKMMLDEIEQLLLGDSIPSMTSDEQSIIAKVNSMCSLIQKDGYAVHESLSATNFEDSDAGYVLGKAIQVEDDEKVLEEVYDIRAVVSRKGDQIRSITHQVDNGLMDCKQSTGSHLPCIISLPQLFVHPSDEPLIKKSHYGL